MADTTPIATIQAEAWEAAAIEARKPRTIFLTHSDVMDGMLSEDHPTLKIRAQMREEIYDALMDEARKIRVQI